MNIEYVDLNNKHKIKNWIESVISNQSWNEQLDLHVDEVSKEFESKERWLKASIEVLRLAEGVMSDLHMDQTHLAIAFFPLRATDTYIGRTFESLEEMQRSFDFTPPSLFICPKDWDNLGEGYTKYWGFWREEFIEEVPYRFYYLEEKRQDGEYLRYVAAVTSESQFILP